MSTIYGVFFHSNNSHVTSICVTLQWIYVFICIYMYLYAAFNSPERKRFIWCSYRSAWLPLGLKVNQYNTSSHRGLTLLINQLDNIYETFNNQVMINSSVHLCKQICTCFCIHNNATCNHQHLGLPYF